MSGGQRQKGEDQHHTGGHDFAGAGKPDAEHDDEQAHEDIGHDGGRDVKGAEGEDNGGGEGSVERDLAFGFQVPGHAADDQEADVNPQHGIGIHEEAESDEGFRDRQVVFEINRDEEGLTCHRFGYSLQPTI